MNYRKDKFGNELSILGYGCMRFTYKLGKPDFEKAEKEIMAAYNAGEGRIADCRRFAEAKGADSSKWEEIVSLIPLMREDSILEEESVKLGKFQGHETIAYVENIMNLYDAFCTICPAI